MKTLYTIGYEGADIDLFVETLLGAGIALVADIRARPFSRKKGFSKSALEQVLVASKIGYRHFGELGDPKAGRDAMKAGDHEKFKRIYNDQFETALAKAQFAELVEQARKKTTCLLCFEKNPIECHRSIVANSMTLEDFQSVNLFTDRTLIENGAFAKRPGRYPGQGLASTEQNLR